ncbi:hypothetical protein DY000_02056847 [Brassica cretica]|uniref:F-box associated domain-containing protein n=1 Tax=Brassica cretica TaxID=69181 RepID=A0ABQ7A5N5_BRACR|nr:hypothetical protein DY000_02056847 [Brassica cretica]
MVLIFNHYCRFLALGINDIAKMQQQFRFRISGSRIVPSSQIALALSVCRSSCLWFEGWMFCAMGFKISTGMVKGAHPFPLSKGIGRCKAASSSITSVLYLKDEITIATAGAPDSLSDVVPWEQIKPSKNILYETCKPEKWFRNSKWYMILLVKTMASDVERFCRNTPCNKLSFWKLILYELMFLQPSVSLSQVLLYYPLDGRLTISLVGKLTVNYTEEGVVHFALFQRRPRLIKDLHMGYTTGFSFIMDLLFIGP